MREIQNHVGHLQRGENPKADATDKQCTFNLSAEQAKNKQRKTNWENINTKNLWQRTAQGTVTLPLREIHEC